LERGNDERDKCFATMGRTTIISSEYFFIIDPDACASDLRHRGIEVTKVICFLRRQDVLSASGYAQDVKALGRSDVIRKVQYEAELDWHSLRNRWTNAFPGAAVEMRAYTSQGLIEKFKAAAGIKAETIDQPDERPNPSLNAEMTEVARIMNARGERPMADRLLALQARLGGASFGFAPEIVKQFEEAYLRSNRALAACFPSGEFDDLGRPGWQPTGVDLSGKVSEDRIRHIMTLLNSPGD
jgi:hypothetical protein